MNALRLLHLLLALFAAATLRAQNAGNLDSAFDPNSNGRVLGLAVQPDGKILLGGGFTTVGGVPRNHLARLNADGTLDADFNPGISGSDVRAIVVQPDGAILIGGNFFKVGAAFASFIARLQPDGTEDTGFNAGALNSVSCIALDADGNILFGGDFTGLSRVGADGTLDTSFLPGVDGNVFSIAVDAQAHVLVGGAFPDVAGVPRNHVARLGSDGSLDPDFHPDPDGNVRCILVQPDGRVLLGGDFSMVAGTPHPHIVRVQSNGLIDPGFAGEADHAVYSGALQADGQIVLAGMFANVDGTTANANLARLGMDGTVDSGFNPNVVGNLYGTALQADGAVLIGGDVQTVDGAIRNHLARLLNGAATQTLSVPEATAVLWQRSGAAPEVSGVTFEQSLDGGATWTMLGNGVPVAGGWQLPGANLAGYHGSLLVFGQTAGGQFNASAGLAEQMAAFDFDTFTVAPSLAAPASGQVTNSPLAVILTLPEPALAGSVTLSFGSIVLTLAAGQESAGTHAFTIDSAAPAADPAAVASVSGNTIIPDGVYRVTLSYQDARGHPAAQITNPNVTIDTAAPVIAAPAGGFSPRIVFVGTACPDYASQASITDATAVNKSQTPAAGGALDILGDQVVTVTATDAAQNIARLEVPVSVRPLTAQSTVVFAEGDAPPGAGGPGGPPGDAKLISLGVPAIDNHGHVAFLAQWSSATGGKGRGLFSNVCLAKVGGDVPGVAGGKFKTFTDPVVDAGQVACLATLAGVPEPAAVLSFDATGALSVVARGGGFAPGTGSAPGIGEATFRSFKAVAQAGANVAFLGRLTVGTGTPRATPATVSGLWVKTAAAPLRLVLREGQVIAGRTIKTLVCFVPGAGSPGQGRGWFTAPDTSRTMALALFTDKTQAVILVDPDNAANTRILSRSGQTGAGGPEITGATFAAYSFPAVNARASTAFLATLTAGSGGVAKATARGIFFNPAGSETFTAIARVGDPAGNSGAAFGRFADAVLASDDGLAFPATLRGKNLRAVNAPTLWWKPGAVQPLRLLAQGGMPPGDLPTGAQWKTFPSLAIPAGRGPVFTATLVPGKGGVTAATAQGVWAADFNGHPRLLFRTGDLINLGGAAGTRKLKSFTLLNALPGSAGVTRSINDAQQVVWRATFTDRSQAIVVTEVP